MSTTSGIWTRFANALPNGGGTGTMLQLTDGSVLAVTSDNQTWARLHADIAGNFANGTWTLAAKMSIPRLYFGSNVLPDGRLWVIGGEYSGSPLAENDNNTSEIYDPLANIWTSTATFPQLQFGDDPTILLASGKILCGYLLGPQTYLYDPATDSFTSAGIKLLGDRSDEETWVILPDGSVLSYDIFASASSTQYTAQRYIPSSDTWVSAGTLPAQLSSSAVGFELGSAMLLPNGTVIYTGANGQNAIYDISSNSWSGAPSLPTNFGADDAPGAFLPDGHFVFAADQAGVKLFSGPTHLFDYDYTTNTLSDITSTLPAALATELAQTGSYVCRMMILPNGHLMLGTGQNYWDYAPQGSPQAGWEPVIQSVAKGTAGSYVIEGNRLTGINQGSSYGDDVECDTNIPLVRLLSVDPTVPVQYAATSNWTPGVSSVGSTAQSSVQFLLPVGFKAGNYLISVVANGIASTPVNALLIP